MRWLQWLLLPVVVAAVMFAVEALCSLPLLTLSQDQQGEIPLDLSQAIVSSAEGIFSGA